MKALQKLWQELGRSIFEGERYRKNLRGIAIGSALIIAVSLVTGLMNLRNGYFSEAYTAVVGVIAGSLLFWFSAYRKKRELAVMVAVVYFMVIYTYDAFFSTNGFAVLWTLLLPMAVGYLGSVKSGILLSFYFQILYLILFFTPMRMFVETHYSPVMMQRFPILYLADVIITTYIMVQYHLSTLHQMDNARQLLEAKEAADRANQAKSDFLADMSHEIRTPINAVLGMNEMVLREGTRAVEQKNADPKMMKEAFGNILTYAGNIRSAGSNLLSIINDILDFSKIESGRMELIEGIYQLSSVLNDVSNMFYFKAKEKNLDFIVEADETLPDRLRGDEVRVRQVITNLLNNAVKYTDHGSVRFIVHGERQGGQFLLIVSVKDTGIGIRKEDADKLFAKFQRVDLRHNSTVEGTGLGLAITQKLLAMMNGSIQVESEYGKGSTFTVIIPQGIISSEPVGNFRPRFEASVLTEQTSRDLFRAPGACILIVDDTKMNLTVAVGLLKGTQIRIDTAGSGAQAVRLARVKAYDLILMDQRMPEMNGTEALSLIRSDPEGLSREVPVICLTADAVVGAHERYVAEGFSDYLSKPIDGAALEQMLMKYLPKEKLLPAAEQATGSGDKGSGPDETAGSFAALRECGVSPEEGLKYCQNDPGFYRLMLLEFVRSAGENEIKLRDSFDKRDWKNYGILVHALKSSSRMIGAGELSELAAGLENAADKGDEAVILERHGALIVKSGRVTQAICDLLQDTDNLQDTEREDAAGDILEFFPDESTDES